MAKEAVKPNIKESATAEKAPKQLVRAHASP